MNALATLNVPAGPPSAYFGQVTEEQITGSGPLDVNVLPDSEMNDQIINFDDGGGENTCPPDESPPTITRPSTGTVITAILAMIEEPELAPSTPPFVILTCAPQEYEVEGNGEHFISFASFDSAIPQAAGPSPIPASANCGADPPPRPGFSPNCFTGYTETDVQISFPFTGRLTDLNIRVAANNRSNPTPISFRVNSNNIYTAIIPSGVSNTELDFSGLSEMICANGNINCLVELPTPGIGSITIPIILAKIEAVMPSDIVLLLDYSGSMLNEYMGGLSKWDSAKAAANLFNVLYAALSETSVDNRIALVQFYTEGSSGPDHTGVTRSLDTPITTTDLVVDPEPGSSNFWTPMGSAVLTGYGAVPPSPNRQRIMILLTDGKENQEPMLDDIRSAMVADPNYVPNRVEDPSSGFQIHAIAFGPPEQIDTSTIQDLTMGGDGLKSYDGELYSTETGLDLNNPFELKQIFMSMLSRIFDFEIGVIGPELGETFTIDPGVCQMVFVVTDDVPFTVTQPAGPPTPIGVITQSGF